MNEQQSNQTKAFHASRYMPQVVIGLMLLLLGGVIYEFAFHQLRSRLRDEITRRDAKVLYTLLANQQEVDNPPVLGEPTDNPADHLASVLETSRFGQLKSLINSGLFDSEGKYVIGFPEELRDGDMKTLSATDFAKLKTLKPISHYHASKPLSELGMDIEPESSAQPISVLEILLPLHAKDGQRLLGVAQFILNGREIDEELRQLDRDLVIPIVIATVAAFAIASLTIAWLRGYSKLSDNNKLLAHRTQSLLHANQELALAAKTSAIGAVTAHLIHGLKNPLSGLQSFMAERTSGPVDEDDLDWNAAVSTTRRMQALINETVRVLREQDSTAAYEISLEEIVELVSSRVSTVARQTGTDFRSRVTGKAQFNNRDANLIVLILENLIHNALQATPSGKIVSLQISRNEDAVVFEVRDEGPGLPEHLKNRLFKPCQSTKEGGSGIGLAISKQLAASLGATLDLQSSSASGCVFVLAVPLKLHTPSAHVNPEPSRAM